MPTVSERPHGRLSAFVTDESDPDAAGHGIRDESPYSILIHSDPQTRTCDIESDIAFRQGMCTRKARVHRSGHNGRGIRECRDRTLRSTRVDSAASRKRHGGDLKSPPTSARPRRQPTFTGVCSHLGGFGCREVQRVVTIRVSSDPLGGSSANVSVQSVRLTCRDPRSDRLGDRLRLTGGGHANPRPLPGRHLSNFSG